MKKITQFSLVLMLFALMSVSYLVTSASADDNILPGMAGGQCDPNPACVENCCAPGPNNHGGPNDRHGGPGSCPEGPGYDACIAAESAASRTGDHHPGGPNDHGDPCMNMPPGPAQADCYRHKDDHRGPGDMNRGPNDHHDGPGDMNRGPNDHRGPPGGENCAAIPHPNGTQHVDPPQSKIDAVEAEYKAGCKAGNCGISPNTYASLESLGHSRQEVDCFLREGERRHNDQHGGPNDHHNGPNDHMNKGPNDHNGPN